MFTRNALDNGPGTDLHGVSRCWTTQQSKSRSGVGPFVVLRDPTPSDGPLPRNDEVADGSLAVRNFQRNGRGLAPSVRPHPRMCPSDPGMGNASFGLAPPATPELPGLREFPCFDRVYAHLRLDALFGSGHSIHLMPISHTRQHTHTLSATQ
jgi:hypothetical protein